MKRPHKKEKNTKKEIYGIPTCGSITLLIYITIRKTRITAMENYFFIDLLQTLFTYLMISYLTNFQLMRKRAPTKLTNCTVQDFLCYLCCT
jgi:hypothetical protein